MISTQVSDKNLELKDFTNWHWFTPKYYNKKCKKGKCEPETVANVSLDLLGDTTCFRLAVRIRPGMVFLAFVAVLHMIFGALAAHNGNTAVAERVAAEDGLPVKRRSSFEPEAAEEVKEDDKEEKGFSMWESISAQVKSVFPAESPADAPPPAPSTSESPIHHLKTEV